MNGATMDIGEEKVGRIKRTPEPAAISLTR